MISDTVRERRDDLAARREPFVTATVVKVTRPTSAAPGDVALIRADGGLEGFVGGVCAQHSVRLYGLEVMRSGEPLLLRIMPDPAATDPATAPISDGQEITREPGTVTVRNPCLSGGAIEVFLEPTLPSPRVLVAGDSPISGALVQFGALLDLEVVASAGRRDPLLPDAGDLALVVAAHGRDELDVLAAAVAAGVPYVGLVASPRRGTAVLGELAEAGVDVSRVETPAGIDIGARTPAEIALSILVRIVELRRSAGAGGAGAELVGSAPVTLAVAHVTSGRGAASVAGSAPAAVPTAQTAVDPVCGMTVVLDADTPRSERNGETFFFCCDGCQRSFDAEPVLG